MTKSQSSKAFGTAADQNAGYNANAQSSYTAATGDIGDYKSELAKFAAENPYVQGGQFQKAQDQALADTAGAQSQQAAQALQAEQARSGQNPAGAIAASEAIAAENARNMTQAENQATQQRLAGLAEYNGNTLNASARPEQMQADLLKTEAGASEGALGQENEAAKTPSFWQELGQGVISAGGQFAGGYGKAMGCWVAARLYGGWGDYRTVLVRIWLHYPFRRHWYGRALMWLYARTGQRIAEQLMPRSPRLTGSLRWLFDKARVRAEEWLATTEGARAHARYWEAVEDVLLVERYHRHARSMHDYALRRVAEVL